MVTNIKDKIKVKDFIKLIKNVEKLYIDSLNPNTDFLNFLKGFRYLLESYKGLSGNEFLELFESSMPNQKIKKEKQSILTELNIKEISFSEVRKIIGSNFLTKEELLEIGECKFGISKGANRRLNKDQLKELIESAMKNIETLKVIKTKAAE